MVLKDFIGLDGVFKLHAGLMGCNLRDADAVTDAGRMSCRVILSVERFDRSGDLVVLKGLDLSAHRRIPTVLFGHNKDYVIGQAEDPQGGYTVRVEGNQLIGETYFHKHTEFGEHAFRLVETKVLRGASIGFIPNAAMVTKSGRVGASGKDGHCYGGAELCEYSHIPLPDNNECIVEAVYKGFDGKPLAQPLLDMLRPLVPERPVIVSGGWGGWFDNATVKALPTKDAAHAEALQEVADEFLPPDHVTPDEDEFSDYDSENPWRVRVNDLLRQIVRGEDFSNVRATARALLEEDPGTDADEQPDLRDKGLRVARAAWTDGYARPVERLAADLLHIVQTDDADAELIQKFCRQMLRRMGRLPGADALVRKHLNAERAFGREWNTTFEGN